MFKLVTKYKPAGDQPKAIDEAVKGLEEGKKQQVLLGVTGSGKTFTIANVIERTQKPTLVLAHNKTLAGQLYAEFKELFPENRVEYFVSYYDYYQPEAYVPSKDLYIEKDSSINDEIDELRHSATSALLTRRDTIVVSSVSCIYNIGEKEDYRDKTLLISVNDKIKRNIILEKLVGMLYERSVVDFKRGTFRVKGDVIEVIPVADRKTGYRIEMFDDTVEKIVEFDSLTGVVLNNKKSILILPASHFVTSDVKLKEAIVRIEKELKERLEVLNKEGKLLEAQRIKERCMYDIEMLKETGFCHGIENYSRHLSLRDEGSTPCTLMDFFDKDYLLVIDESHVTLPQVHAMYNGDRQRKQTLVDYGFRLPSALDNRPLTFEEFEKKINQVIYVSATPGDYELDLVHNKCIEQIIRPTGLIDPIIEIRTSKNQIDDIIYEIRQRISRNERVLITTLTIRMSEELSSYLKEMGINVAYLHSEIKTLERLNIIRNLRLGKIDVIVGINLLREGIDIPEVSLIAIFDADKQGFLRSKRSLIQTIGRAARNSSGKVIMYADTYSDAMKGAIEETDRRRIIQTSYNESNNIIPTTIIKDIRDVVSSKEDIKVQDNKKMSKKEKENVIKKIEVEMRKAAKDLDFERAMELRDAMFEISLE
ncbi:MAG: excinuclease ABC subunit UvrB [Bacilli bacterium]